MTIRATAFWGATAAAGWVLAGYPLSLLLRPARPWRQDEAEPAVSVIIPAYHEREALAEKLAALRTTLDYPRDRLQVIVAADDDPGLAETARAAYPEAVVDFRPGRGGKAKALDRALAHATGEIVVLTDANNVLAPQSVRAAVRHFADPAVWAVAGRRGEAGSAYDRYEDAIRRLETRSGSVAAMSGEFMAVRRERVPRFPEGIVNDDFWLLCQVVRAGGRVVYEPEAASTEPALGAGAEVARRSRMGAGRTMLAGEALRAPGELRWRLLSHKLGRLALPFLLAAALVSSLSLAGRPGYRRAAAAQVGWYGAGLLGILGVAPRGRAGLPLRAAGQFLLGNAAVAAGVVRGLRGRQPVRWETVR